MIDKIFFLGVVLLILGAVFWSCFLEQDEIAECSVYNRRYEMCLNDEKCKENLLTNNSFWNDRPRNCTIVKVQ